ncbi:hypothetical protein [Dyadobacter sp. 676]|uniref:Uncharacterized protein n=1 Tax=Dyadobacter sp. 676 TaxID=3088362 RepID=A0AAU8FL20_9BACT
MRKWKMDDFYYHDADSNVVEDTTILEVLQKLKSSPANRIADK